MKKLMLSIGLLGGVLLSSSSVKAACVAADCAALGYSTATVDGCTRYIVCPFDTSYKACASTSSETTAPETCEDIIAASGGIYLADGDLYQKDLTITSNGSVILTDINGGGSQTIATNREDVVIYSHYNQYNRIYIEGNVNVTFKEPSDIDGCMGYQNGFSAQLVYIGNDLMNSVKFVVPAGGRNSSINILQLGRGAAPTITFKVPDVSIGFFNFEPVQYTPSPTIFLSTLSDGHVPTLQMNTWCTSYSGACNINIATDSVTTSQILNWHDCGNSLVYSGSMASGGQTTLTPYLKTDSGFGSGSDSYVTGHYLGCEIFKKYCQDCGSSACPDGSTPFCKK